MKLSLVALGVSLAVAAAGPLSRRNSGATARVPTGEAQVQVSATDSVLCRRVTRSDSGWAVRLWFLCGR